MFRIVSVTILMVGLAVAVYPLARGADDAPPEELYSPDKHCSVRILHTALPGSDPDNGFYTLAVRSGDHYISKYPTEGYLLDAFWSPNGKYVAVDNRRGNSGEYLWVFSLTDGRALRMPDDARSDWRKTGSYWKQAEDLVSRVTAKFPELTFDQVNKFFTFAHGWTKAGELQVKTNFAFRNLPDEIAVIWGTYKITNNELVLMDERVEKAPWPPKNP